MPIRGIKTTYYENGTPKETKPAVSVQFQLAGYIPDYAKEAVSKMPDWGRGIGLNEDPFERCGIFDSVLAAEKEGWDEETVAEVEAALRRVAGASFVIADKPKTEKPWPNYDSLHADNDYEAAFAISKKVVEDGYDPKAVKRYEVENQNRALVNDALDLLIAEDEADVLGVIPA